VYVERARAAGAFAYIRKDRVYRELLPTIGARAAAHLRAHGTQGGRNEDAVGVSNCLLAAAFGCRINLAEPAVATLRPEGCGATGQYIAHHPARARCADARRFRQALRDAPILRRGSKSKRAGSARGIADVMQGKADIAMVSRPMYRQRKQPVRLCDLRATGSAWWSTASNPVRS
jgi:hypothetical protein